MIHTKCLSLDNYFFCKGCSQVKPAKYFMSSAVQFANKSLTNFQYTVKRLEIWQGQRIVLTYVLRNRHQISLLILTHYSPVFPEDSTEKICAHWFLAKPKTIAARGSRRCPGGGKAPKCFFFFCIKHAKAVIVRVSMGQKISAIIGIILL